MSFAFLWSLALASTPAVLGDSLAAGSSTEPGLARSVAHLPRTIDSIDLINHGALEGSKIVTPGDSILYRWAEALRDDILHSRTQRSTVQRRLLIAPGDRLDSARLQESERLLRTERFLADAKIRDTTLGDGRTLVRIETWDRWSTGIIASTIRSGGIFSWVLGVRESNLLGTGQDVSFSYGEKDSDPSWTVGYTNTALLRQGFKLESIVTVLDNGHLATFDLGFPVLHRYQKWAWRLKGSDESYRRDVFATPEVAHILSQRIGAQWVDNSWFSSGPDSKNRQVQASITRLWGDEIRLYTTVMAESELDSAASPVSTFSFPASQLESARRDPLIRQWLQRPGHRDDRRLGAELSLRKINYLRLRNFNNLKWTEDIPVGWSVTTTGAVNVLSRGEIRDAGYIQVIGNWTAMTGELYGSGSGAWKSFLDDDGNFAQGSLTLRSEGRWVAHRTLQLLGGVSSTTLMGAPAWVRETTLGEDNGLPGWPANSISGRGRLLTTSELRFIPPLEAFTLAPALALFGGAGRVSPQADPLGDGPWRAGVGFGIRLGMTRSPNGLINHISLSHPVGETDREMGWLLSFGSYKSL